MLDQITPVILTYNEELNIGRVLERLTWAKTVVVVDSFSTDGTLDIISRFPTVRVFQRKFDSHAVQWNYAIHETGIETNWVLALDADYVLTSELEIELTELKPGIDISAFQASFKYCVFGKPLRSTLYQPVTVLFQREGAQYIQDGHTQRVVVEEKIGMLVSQILHDDRKLLASWLQAQDRYMTLEAAVIRNTSWGALSLSDKIRKMIVVAPVVIFFYCLFVKQGILDGWRGLYYALQRSVAEIILSLKLIRVDIEQDE